ncbi:hypothetical protein PGT21_005621 [Puccinia graminis f. sp. tritici]|nr:hypothetical protein PGTUg99_011961 [Puccinia graminis f. sp. tritici]KAA1114345.1 hypothetical protein PGT21_005621 [Puccinia graminis f. sp. tritici]
MPRRKLEEQQKAIQTAKEKVRKYKAQERAEWADLIKENQNKFKSPHEFFRYLGGKKIEKPDRVPWCLKPRAMIGSSRSQTGHPKLHVRRLEGQECGVG